MIIDKNRQQLLADLAEVTEIVVKTTIDVADKNAPAIAKAIFSFLDAVGKEADRRKPKDSSVEETVEKLGEFFSTLLAASINKQMKDGFGPAGYV